MDILIARLMYPNDVTKKIVPHQNYVALVTDEYICLYSISSILGKELRIEDEMTKDHYEIIKASEINENNFLKPSFIDCSKMYRVNIDDTIDLTKLSHRSISDTLKERIDNRIYMLKQKGEHTTYVISLSDFKSWNLKAVKEKEVISRE